MSMQLTSKLWNTHHRAEDVEAAVDASLADLQTDYLDLYLVRFQSSFFTHCTVKTDKY